MSNHQKNKILSEQEKGLIRIRKMAENIYRNAIKEVFANKKRK